MSVDDEVTAELVVRLRQIHDALSETADTITQLAIFAELSSQLTAPPLPDDAVVKVTLLNLGGDPAPHEDAPGGGAGERNIHSTPPEPDPLAELFTVPQIQAALEASRLTVAQRINVLEALTRRRGGSEDSTAAGGRHNDVGPDA